MYKILVLAAVLAYAELGLIRALPVASYRRAAVPTAITSQSSNILRSFGNLGQVSTYTKTVDTPFSSVRKTDVRVSNPGLATLAHPPVAYVSPGAYTHAAPLVAARTYAPAVTAVEAPVITSNGLLGVAYSEAPAVSHIAFDGLGAHYAW